MRTLIPLFVFLAACDGGKDLGNGPYCEDTPTDLALDDPTDLGFTAAAVLARLPANEVTTLTWDGGATTGLLLGYTPATSARFVDSEAVYPDDGGETPAIGVICDDRVEIDLDFTLLTDDGAFDEDLAAPIRATAVDAAEVTADLDLDGLQGSFVFDDFTGGETYDDRSAEVRFTIGDQVTSGSIHGQISGEGDCTDGDTCTAWAAEIPIGTWGPDNQ